MYTVVYTNVCKRLYERNIPTCTLGYVQLVNIADTKIHKVDSRHTLYLRKELVEDTSFPFEADESLTVRIDNDRLIIERKKGK